MKSNVPENHKKDITVNLVCGSIAGLLGQTFTYPPDVVRRQMQVIYMISTSLKHLYRPQSEFRMIENNPAGPKAPNI